MTKHNHELHFTARLDRRLLSRRGGVRHLLVDVTAPDGERPADAERPPLDLALVIDASGSMTGPPLEAAKRAAAGVVEALGPRDRITVTSFADDVIRHVGALSAADGGRARALTAIRELETRGCTDLAGGWTDGVQALDRARRDGAQRRVVILSDGHANVGEIDPETLGLQAAAARDRGVVTTAVGIGDGYSSTQLGALCEHGGGNLHHAARAEEILEVVAGELGEILHTAAEGVTLRMELPDGVRAEALGPFPVRDDGAGPAVGLGTLIAGAQRRVTVRLTCPAGGLGDRLSVLATPCWRRPGETEERRAPALVLDLLYAPALEVATETPDTALGLQIAQAWQRDLIRRATALAEEGDREGARAFLKEARPAFRDYVRDLPGGRELLGELDRFRGRLKRSLSRGLAKEVNCFLVKQSMGVSDLRASSAFRMEDIDELE